MIIMKKYILVLVTLLVSTTACASGFYGYGGRYYGPYPVYRGYPFVIQPVFVSQGYYPQPVVVQTQPQPVIVQQQPVMVQAQPQQQTATEPVIQADPQSSNVYTGNSRVAGDQMTGSKEAYESWKTACDDWKKQIISLNTNRILSVDCGTPHDEKDSVTFEDVQVSQGVYKLIVRN
jgi:hypothetical protein